MVHNSRNLIWILLQVYVLKFQDNDLRRRFSIIQKNQTILQNFWSLHGWWGKQIENSLINPKNFKGLYLRKKKYYFEMFEVRAPCGVFDEGLTQRKILKINSSTIKINMYFQTCSSLIEFCPDKSPVLCSVRRANWNKPWITSKISIKCNLRRSICFQYSTVDTKPMN